MDVRKIDLAGLFVFLSGTPVYRLGERMVGAGVGIDGTSFIRTSSLAF